MIYMTILHWLSLAFYLLLFVLLVVVSRKESRSNVFWSMVFASFLVTVTAAVFTLFVLDKYTKKGKLSEVRNHRILKTEEIVFKGSVQNVGSFTIGRCRLNIKMVNNPIESGKLSGSQIFQPRSGIFDIFKSKEKERESTISRDFIVAKMLKSGKTVPFTIRMPYPGYFKNTKLVYHLYCH